MIGPDGLKVVPKMKLIFEWDGVTVHKETSGFEGKQCERLTDFIEKGYHAAEENRNFKPEYHHRDPEDGIRIDA